MRSLLLGSFFGLTGALLAGCGDDGGSGGGDTTTSTTTTASSSPTTTSSSTSGSTTTGMNMQCTELTIEDLGRLLPEYFIAYPMIGGAEEDVFGIEFYAMDLATITGTIDLSQAPNNNYGTCEACVLLNQDYQQDGTVAKTFFLSSGTLELGASSPPHMTGALNDVTLVEVTLANPPDDYTSTPVPNGECYHITSLPLDFPAPPMGWTCEGNLYDDNLFCDCTDCGVIDPDCMDTTIPVYECEEGQTCNTADFTCEGVPTAWMCPDDQYAGGAGNGCDCNCGTVDPDCALMGEVVDGCMMDEVCTTEGTCLPTAWTCLAGYYNSGSMDDCDCGCGAVDPDCPDAMSSSCDFCNNEGSCAEMEMGCGTINPTNNAVCQ